MQTTKVSINNKIDANFIKIIPILYHKKRLMETRNRGIYRKVRLLRLWVIFVIMKVIKSYNTLNDYYRKFFGEKTFKVPIDAGFDCPNRDGTVAHGGCTFCTVSGSGDTIVAPDAPIREQFYKEIDFMHRKWPDVQKYLVYFQNFTNTHEKVEVIRERYEQAINEPGVVGINIGMRPDCLPDESIEYLAELSECMHVTIELGLQTTYEATSDLINRAHSYEL